MSVKERIGLFIKYKNISVRKFELTCGLSLGYINNMRVSMQPDKVTRIASNYPELNTGWLMTGEGEMLKEIPTNSSNKPFSDREISNGIHIPLLPVSAQAGSLNDFVMSIKKNECEIIISPIVGADYAISIAGNSMAPEYPSGSKILIKKINESAFIEWGKVYVLDTVNGTIVKQVIPSEKENYLKCVSINPDQETYAPFEVDSRYIIGMYRVLLCMSIK